MIPEQARDAITRLNAALRKAGLDWVVEEVSTAVGRGIEERKQVAFERFDDSDAPTQKRGPKSEVTTTRPLTEVEELRLLIRSMHAALVGLHEVKEAALTGLKTEQFGSPQIAFRPDIPEGFEVKGYSVPGAQRGQAFDLSSDGVEAQKPSIGRLKLLLADLEDMIDAN